MVSGRKINQITRWLTIVITLVQGPTYIYNLIELYLVVHFIRFNSFEFLFSSVIILSYRYNFCHVVRRKITDKGIGNGISL
jgi:preprotein translocase subunit SecY